MTEESSAGGVVYKFDPNLMILVCQHSYHHGWVFPKGLIGDREDIAHEEKEETAVREVKEETGIEAIIERPLSPIWYTYFWNGENEKEEIKKTVYYFLMRATGGDTAIHDEEMENVEWIPAEEVEKRLTYPSDKRVWKEAKQLIPQG